jgi:hypothetical protein
VAHSAPQEDRDDEPKPDDHPAEPSGTQDGEPSPAPRRVAQERSPVEGALRIPAIVITEIGAS